MAKIDLLGDDEPPEPLGVTKSEPEPAPTKKASKQRGSGGNKTATTTAKATPAKTTANREPTANEIARQAVTDDTAPAAGDRAEQQRRRRQTVSTVTFEVTTDQKVQLLRWAKDNGRSMKAEAIARLFPNDD